MEKRSNLSKGEEKIPLQICDIILPTAHIQTKQGCVSGFHLVLSSPPHPLPPPPSPFPSFFPFFSPFCRESGRRKRTVAELQETGSLSHPRLELSTTAPLVGDRAGVCLFLSQPFTPFTPDPSLSLCSSFIGDSLLSGLPFGKCWKSQQGEFTRRIMSKSPACSHFT